MRRARGRVALYGALVALVALIPLVVDDRFTLRVLTFLGVNVIIVVGMSLLFGYAGQVSLGHGAFYGLGAYTTAILTTMLGWPWIASILAGVAIAAIGGLALAVPSLRLKGHYLAMATLGFGEIVVVLFVNLRSVTGGPDGLGGISAPSIGPSSFTEPWQHYALVWAVAVVSLILGANMIRVRPGRALKAVHGSELGAQAAGIDVVRLKIKVFTVSAALAGLAGTLYAHYVGFISPGTFSLEFSIILVAMVVLGGTCSLAGAVAGAVLLTLLPFIDAFIPGMSREVSAFVQDWMGVVYGLTIILVMLFMPKGLAGAARSLSARIARRRGAEEAT